MWQNFLGFGLIIYGLVLFIFLKNSFREFSGRVRVPALAALANFMLCLLWPLTLLGFAILSRPKGE